MASVKKLTISYSASEDRLHLAFQMTDEAALRMWLTQRLARQLVMGLREHGAKLSPPARHRESRIRPSPVEAGEQRSSNVSSPSAAVDEEKLQAAAPVAVLKAAPVWLIRKIVLTIGKQTLRLQFESELDFVPTTFVTRNTAASWLRSLRRYFMIAGWSLDLWPSDQASLRRLNQNRATCH